ncbi:DUF4411 family protein [Lentibacillus lipolyticus]|nr:DUF4411 family protein [Lentibacillus lipolyticus]
MGKIKHYTLDTNVFRYKTEENNLSNLKYQTHKFWKKIKDEITNNEAILVIPKEVINELEVQSFTLKDSQVKKINKLISLCIEVAPERLTQEMEHLIRNMQAYIRANFKRELGRKQVEYGGVSDARILYTAYCQDSILVTANVRDFLLYPLLYPQGEDILYDLKENDFVRIPCEGYEKIHEDAQFKSLLGKFYTLDN